MKEKVLTTDRSFRLLKKYRIPMAKFELVKTVGEAEKVAKKIGFPVVLKIISPGIVHKTDVGGIILDIKTEGELRDSFNRLLLDVKRKAAKIRISGVLVQKMIGHGREVIIGGKKDSQFGQTLMFGGGGILTEVMEDVSFRVCPINRKDAEEMVKETKYYKVLKGYRGKACDINAWIEILLKASKLLEENQEIVELDINPVIALSKGAVAVDARIVID